MRKQSSEKFISFPKVKIIGEQQSQGFNSVSVRLKPTLSNYITVTLKANIQKRPKKKNRKKRKNGRKTPSNMNLYRGSKNKDEAGRGCSDEKNTWVRKFVLKSQVMLISYFCINKVK